MYQFENIAVCFMREYVDVNIRLHCARLGYVYFQCTCAIARRGFANAVNGRFQASCKEWNPGCQLPVICYNLPDV